MAASPIINEAVVAEGAPAFCFVCTETSGGSRLVATLNLRLNSTLADARSILVSVAKGGTGGAAATTDEPVNVTPAQAKVALEAHLHPFDFTSNFRFVCCGGARAYRLSKEYTLLIGSILPRYPRLGAPSTAGRCWSMKPEIPTVVVPLVQRVRKGESTADAPSFTHPPKKRLGLCVLFVAQGRGPAGWEPDQALRERLLLQSYSSSYGHSFDRQQWSKTVSKWNANIQDVCGRTLLHEAALEGNTAAVQFLLSCPFVRVNQRDRQGNTALHLAARTNRPQVAQWLLDAGAHPLAVNDHARNTPLHVALLRRHAALVGLLCGELRGSGVEPSSLAKLRNADGASPLTLFEAFSPSLFDLCADGSLAAAKALTGHFLFTSSHLTARDVFSGGTVVHVAAASGNLAILRYVMAELKPWTRLSGQEGSLDWWCDTRRQTPLHLAAQGGHLECVSYLAETATTAVSLHVIAALLTHQDINGDTPLLTALKRRHVRVAEFFVFHCVSGTIAANAQDLHGLSALHLASGLGLPRIVEALIEQHGANKLLRAEVSGAPRVWGGDGAGAALITERRKRTGAPKMHRMQHSAPRAAPRPFASSSSPSSAPVLAPPHMYGSAQRPYTPLLCALIAGHHRHRCDVEATLEVLCRRGDDLPASSKEDCADLLFFLISRGHYELADWVHRRRDSSPIVAAVRADNELLCRFCASKDASGIRWCVERRYGQLDGNGGPSPLAVSASIGDVDTLEWLLRHRADVNAAPSASAPSLLMVAISCRQEGGVRTLVRAGARLGSGDGAWSALRLAASTGLEGVVRGLVGLPGVRPPDVFMALLESLRSMPMRPSARAASQGRICVYLAKHVDLTMAIDRAAVHPTELLHLSASRGLFEVTATIAQRLLELPTTTLVDIMRQTPAAPARRFVSVEPTMVPLTVKAPRLLPNRRTGRGGLYKPPAPFERLVLPNWKITNQTQSQLPTRQRLWHRMHLRDAFSYAAAANMGDLVELLGNTLGMHPWVTTDQRGWTSMDHALEHGSADLIRFFAAAGLRPRARHGRRAPGGALGPLVRAVHAAEMASDGPAYMAAMLCSLVREDDVGGFRHLLAAYCRSRSRACGGSAGDGVAQPVEEGAGLADEGAWLAEVALECVRYGRIDALRWLHDELRYPLTLAEGGEAIQPLLAAVYRRDEALITYLLHAGCDPHTPSPATAEMTAHVRVKKVEEKRVTPLCLAAWMGSYTVMALLLSAGPVRGGECMDDAENVADSLGALVRRTVGATSHEERQLMASTVRLLANAGHPNLSPLILREAARKGLDEVVHAIVECYGARAVIADLIPGQVNSLFYMAGSKSQCGLLRSLLVQTETDEFGIASFVFTDLARAVVSMYGGSHCKADEKANTVVDYALTHGCAEGALLLLALGLTGNGEALGVGQTSGRVGRTRAVLRHYCAARPHYAPGAYTVLHSAVALGHADVLVDLLSEMRTFASIAPIKTPTTTTTEATSAHNGGDAGYSSAGRTDGGRAPAAKTVGLPPSVYALAAGLHRKGAAWLPLFERVAPAATVTARDYLLWTFSGTGVTRAIDAVCRHPSNLGVCGEMFSLYDPPGDTAGFLSQLLHTRSRCLLLEGGALVLTAMSPLACAVAAGSLEWAQYLAFCGPPIAAHRAIATRRSRTVARAPSERSSPQGRHHRQSSMPPRHPQHVKHICRAGSVCVSPLPPASQESQGVDVLVLCVAFLAEAHWRRDKARVTQQEDLLKFLLSVRGALTRKNANVVAVAVASLQRWDLVHAIIARATAADSTVAPPHNGSNDAGSDVRFFQCVLSEEIPTVLRRAVGSARHIMHVAACCAPTETLLEIVRHCARSDVEAACDARGRTSVFHAMHHPSTVRVLDMLKALRVPVGPSCSRRWERTALMVAASEGRVALVTALMKPDRVNQVDRKGNSALMLAAAHGHLEVVELLLASGADPSLANQLGMTAAMLAAEGGHDHVAAPITQHFSKKRDLVTAQSSLLHCAAVGGCWRAAECALQLLGDADADVLRRDVHGLSALALAHYFGSARVLRMLLVVLYRSPDGAAAVAALGAAAVSPGATAEDVVEHHVLGCDAAIVHYGWLRGTLAVNEALGREATGQHRDSLGTRPGELVCAPRVTSLSASRSCLLWCSVSNNAVGVRVLADLNVADNCGALLAAARCGNLDVVKLLVKLEMSDMCQRAAETNFLPFEVAALASHKECALYLLNHTPLSVAALLTEWESGPEYAHTIFHRLAPVCGGIVLTRLVELLLEGGAQHTLVASRLLAQLQRPDEVGFTPFECAIAMGNAASVARVADALQRLGELASATTGVQHKNDSTEAPTYVSVSNALFSVLPMLSPAVRTLLFDFFEITAVATRVGFAPPGKSARGRAGRSLLRFSDVRLLGVEALKADELLAPMALSTFTPDHERDVLQALLQDFPYRIRYTPDSFRACTAGQQTQLLQWLGSSLVLSAYSGLARRGVDTVEVKVIRHRSEECVAITAGGSTLEHSLYIASSGAVVMPNLNDALSIKTQRYCDGVVRELKRLCVHATRLLRALPHPSLRTADVVIEWSPSAALASEAAGAAGEAAREAQRQRVESVFQRVRGGLHRLIDAVEVQLRDLLSEVAEDDIAAVVGATARPPPVRVVLRYTEDPTLPRFPSDLDNGVHGVRNGHATTVILFNAASMTDVGHVFHNAIYRSIATDVALVRVHYARDEFAQSMQTLRASWRRQSKVRGEQILSSSSLKSGTDEGGVKFKLELEGSPLDAIPIPLLRQMLQDVVAAVRALRCRPSSPGAHGMRRFHSAEIISEAVSRRVRTVLVLFTSKRGPLVRLSGNKLMLCFTVDLAPVKVEITEELRRAIVEDEIAVCMRLLPEVVTAMKQRLSTYLPSTTLTVSVQSIERSCGGDREHVLSALRLLVFKHSVHVLQPLIDGISVGWDTPIGTLVREGLSSVSVIMETGECSGRCGLSPSGNFVYYCPLACVQAGSYWRSSWQLLTAQQVASLLLLQLPKRRGGGGGAGPVSKHIDTSKSYPCWTAVERVPCWVGAGEAGSLLIRARNMLNYRLRGAAAATGDQFRFIGGAIEGVSVKEEADGCYAVRWQAPTRAGVHKLYVMLRGQQLFNSPLLLSVRPGDVDLSLTSLVTYFNTVVAMTPFTLQLRLVDTHGNRLHRAPPNFAVSKAGVDADVELIRWFLRGSDTVEVTLRVRVAKPSFYLSLHLSADADSGVDAESDKAQGAFSIPLDCVDPHTYEQILTLRRGRTLESIRSPKSPRSPLHPATGNREKLFFRKSIRTAERARLARDAALIGGIKGKVFPPCQKDKKKSVTSKDKARPAMVKASKRSDTI